MYQCLAWSRVALAQDANMCLDPTIVIFDIRGSFAVQVDAEILFCDVLHRRSIAMVSGPFSDAGSEAGAILPRMGNPTSEWY